MGTVEAAVRPAFRRSLFARQSAVRMAEILLGGLLFLVLLQVILGFSLLDPDLWRVYSRSFWNGILRTLGYIALILPVSVAVGFCLGWARVSRYRAITWPVSVYIEFFRGVPPLFVLIFASILGPTLLPERFQSVELGLTLGALTIAFHSAAFQAEIFRAGFQSVSRGQVEAAQAIGMRGLQSMRHVILPQALRLSLPPLANEFAVVIKDTSLLAAIAAGELFHLSQRIQDTIIRGGGSLDWLFAIWTAVAVVYFVMTFCVTRAMLLLERKVHARGLEALAL